MEVGDVVSGVEWWNEMPVDWWKEVGEHLEREILGRLPAEDVYRYRRVCNKWKILLSSKYFITHTWPDAAINKQSWLVLCDLLPNNPCMGFCFNTQTWKPCFSLCFPDEEQNIEVKCRGSAAGLVLVDRKNLAPRVCNPYSGNSVQLPPMLAIGDHILFKCIAEDNNNNNRAYKVVAIGIDENIQASVVEMYDSSQQTWKVFGPIPEYRPLFDFSSFVCCDDSYYSIITESWSVFGFTVTTVNEEPEPNPISILLVPIPEPVLRNLLEIQLVTCGLRLLLAAPIEEIMGEQVITIYELELENKQCHPLSTNNRMSWAWKEIGRMPAAMFDVLGIAIPPRYSCPWRNHYWKNGYPHLESLWPMVFQPRLDTQVQ